MYTTTSEPATGNMRETTPPTITNQQRIIPHPNETLLNATGIISKPKNIFRLAPARGLGRHMRVLMLKT